MFDLSSLNRIFFPWLPNRKYAPVPTGAQLVSDVGEAVIHCPRCNSPQRAIEKLFERRAIHGSRWQPFFRAYQCQACQSLYNVEHCTPVDDGILVINPWNCPLCQQTNLPGSRQCTHCGAGGEDPEP